MAKSTNSARWLKEHFDDPYVLQAQREGYRSRAVYKLQELDQRYQIFKPGMTIVELGAAPGGWTQYVAKQLAGKGQILASDILPLEPIAGVEFIQGDFCQQTVFATILQQLKQPVDLVLSDMAPNISGIQAVDIPRALHLVELVHDFARQVLKSEGMLLCKLLQGQGTDTWLQALRRDFAKVIIKKPKASRPRSREVYVWASNFHGNSI